ncbi:3-phosphoshikimate 1-carboxyvinyltransferase [Listeria monocytogenes N53-1]|nr:3-phosphoshikimate 1-carboxyvinyltransferase [Listeria monocytogenes N53-1]
MMGILAGQDFGETSNEPRHAAATTNGGKNAWQRWASAQVKSAIIFAALQAEGETIIHEKEKTRE